MILQIQLLTINVLNIIIKHNKEIVIYNIYVVCKNVIHNYYAENVNINYLLVNMKYLCHYKNL